MRDNGGELPSKAIPLIKVPGLVLVPSSGSKCVACGVVVSEGCTNVPYYARLELLLDHKLLLPPVSNCRICNDHLNGQHLKDNLAITSNFQVEDDSEAAVPSKMATDVILDLIEGLSHFKNLARLHFDDEATMNDEDYRVWTGWTKAQFASFLLYLKEAKMRNTGVRSLPESLAIFWIKLKADLSYSQIASLLGVKDENLESGRLRVRDAFLSVESALASYFVPSFLGPEHLTPEEAKAHNTVYSTAFFGDKATTIWDGTYLYTYRSENYAAGRKFYSMHKGRTLAKFMSIVLPDGYVLDTIGPFASNGDNQQ